MRSEYILGKLAVLFSFLLLVTFVPAILLLLLKVAFDGSFLFLKNNALPGAGDHGRQRCSR